MAMVTGCDRCDNFLPIRASLQSSCLYYLYKDEIIYAGMIDGWYLLGAFIPNRSRSSIMFVLEKQRITSD